MLFCLLLFAPFRPFLLFDLVSQPSSSTRGGAPLPAASGSLLEFCLCTAFLPRFPLRLAGLPLE